GWNIWESYNFLHESYPDETFFDNTQHSFTGQLRIQPSWRSMFVVDASYSVKVFSEDLQVVQRTGKKGTSRLAADPAGSTSRFDLGAGGFFRPWSNTLAGLVVADQITPNLHPR